MIYQKCKKMTDGMAGAFFTVEAAILYPLVLAVIVLIPSVQALPSSIRIMPSALPTVSVSTDNKSINAPGSNAVITLTFHPFRSNPKSTGNPPADNIHRGIALFRISRRLNHPRYPHHTIFSIHTIFYILPVFPSYSLHLLHSS